MCDVTGGDASGIELKLHRAGVINGTAVVEGSNDPKLRAQLRMMRLFVSSRSNQATGPINSMRTINANGSFQIKGLPPGKILIQPGNLQLGLTLARIERDGAPVKDGIEVIAGETVTGVRLIFTYGTITQRGEVKVVGGSVPTDFKFGVSFRRSDQGGAGGQFVQVDARGQFVAENLSPGEYDVRLSFMGYPGMGRPDPALIRALSATTTKITIGRDNPPPITLTIDLSKKEGTQ